MLGYFVASIVHGTLTWTTGSLTCVGDLFCIHGGGAGGGTSVHSLVQTTFVESAQHLTLEKSQGGQKA